MCVRVCVFLCHFVFLSVRLCVFMCVCFFTPSARVCVRVCV